MLVKRDGQLCEECRNIFNNLLKLPVEDDMSEEETVEPVCERVKSKCAQRDRACSTVDATSKHVKVYEIKQHRKSMELRKCMFCDEKFQVLYTLEFRLVFYINQSVNRLTEYIIF